MEMFIYVFLKVVIIVHGVPILNVIFGLIKIGYFWKILYGLLSVVDFACGRARSFSGLDSEAKKVVKG